MSLNDQLDMIEVFSEILKTAGYESLMTTSKDWARAILRSGSIDLFTQDLMRLGIGGWAFVREMKSDPVLRQIPIVIITAASRASQLDEVGRSGLDIERDLAGYLQMPFDSEELLDLIRKCFR